MLNMRHRKTFSLPTPANFFVPVSVIIAVGGATFTWIVGHRGLFLLDQSMVIDGGWRIYLGQKPFRDFLMPFGPVTFWIQALFFKLMGVEWSATVAPACLMGGIGTLVSARITYLLTGSQIAAVLSSFLTSLSFTPPFGTLWMDQTAMFFGLLAIHAAVEAAWANKNLGNILAGLSGMLIVTAVMSKQNFGLLIAPIVVLLLPTTSKNRRAWIKLSAALLLGLLIGLLLFLIYLHDSWSNYYSYSIQITSELARKRISLRAFINAVTFRRTSLIMQPDVSAFCIGTMCLCLAVMSRFRPEMRQIVPAALLATLLPLYRSVTQAITANEVVNGYALSGLAIGLGLGLLFHLAAFVQLAIRTSAEESVDLISVRPIAILGTCGLMIWSGVFSVMISRHAWFRTAQQFRPGARFDQALNAPGMRRLLWGEPTIIRNVRVTRQEFDTVVERISSRRHSFFVMGDSTILYAFVGVQPPQPMLYFLEGHSFLKTQADTVDWIVAQALERNKVGTVVLEKITHLAGTQRSIWKLRRTTSVLARHFQLSEVIGNYEIWDRCR